MDAKGTNPWVVAVAVAALVLALAALIVGLDGSTNHGPGMMGGDGRYGGRSVPGMMGERSGMMDGYGYHGGRERGMMDRSGTCTARYADELPSRDRERVAGCGF